ncbi:unannotated protein [freshwater metagenome]|uniref:Unannotated protein n=1 Tax=freshwater metagenome TaxID=449393 RepID=A0A6J6XH54_9ZZZZ
MRSTCSKSTSTLVYTCALVALDRVVCSAVIRRTFERAITSSPRSIRGLGSVTAFLGAGDAASTSCLVMRPPSPVPTISLASKPRCVISRRTTGEVTSPFTGVGACTESSSPTALCALAFGDAALLLAPVAAASSVTTATRSPTGTVEPSVTRISVITPAIGDGTSVSTLSVVTSYKGSSALTCSPTALSQRVIVAEVTVSPSWGIVMSITSPQA